MSGIFINYRRADSEDYAKRIFKHLSKQFGGDQVFMDVNRLEPGEKFRDEIKKVLVNCDFFIVIIGTAWLTVNEDGHTLRRIDMATDLLRQELEFALENQLDIIPVLVDDATLPSKDALPKSIQGLRDFHKISITSKTGTAQIDKIANQIKKVRAAREQKRQELAATLIAVTTDRNLRLEFGSTHVQLDYREPSILSGSVFLGDAEAARNLIKLITIGVCIMPLGSKRPFHTLYGRIDWGVQANMSHVPVVIEDLIYLCKLSGNNSYESIPIVTERWTDD